ncbi:MAG: phospho-sugar mutase, partial [Solobacterium sp.]|nr:phospho-sugar mutase [Solobacterium sp.]
MDAVKNYERWLNHPDLDPALKQEMEQMNEEQINDAFYSMIEFGTAGMRGVMGAGTARINIHTIRKATKGFADWINEQGTAEKGVAIGYDNRHNSRKYAFDCASVLACNGIPSFVFDSLRPTPELSFAVRHLHCTGGIMITAS